MNQRFKPFQNLKLALIFFAVSSTLWAQSEKTSPTPSPSWGSLDVGAQYVGWDSTNVLPFNGSEILFPMTFSVDPWKGGHIYAQTQFTMGNYTDSALGPSETFNLTGLTDTILGFQTDFKFLNLPSILNVGANIPTGDPTWETKQTNSIVPTEFIDSDYRGRGFGISLLYGFSMPAGKEQYGVAGGYMYSGAFNPAYGQGAPADQLKLGDSVFLSMNRASDHGGGQFDIIRVSAFYFLTTQQNGSNLLQMGPNLNASYSWNNSKAFSFEAGGQYFLPTQQMVNGQLTPEAYDSLGPRFYLNPSYAFGDLILGGKVKYILANGYPPGDIYHYDGGGILAGLEPTLRLKLDSTSSLKFSAGFDYVLFKSGSIDSQGNREDVQYGHWTFGTHYEVNL